MFKLQHHLFLNSCKVLSLALTYVYCQTPAPLHSESYGLHCSQIVLSRLLTVKVRPEACLKLPAYSHQEG